MRENVVVFGVVSTMDAPLDLRAWLDHYRAVLNPRHMFLFVTDDDDIPASSDITVIRRPAKKFAYNFWDVQASHVNSIRDNARALGITHLLHVDDDELLRLPQGVSALQVHIAQHLNVACFVVQNWEARTCSGGAESPFSECFLFEPDVARFNAYANGKSIGRVDATALGAHCFNGTQQTLPPHTAVVLHYEGVNFPRWAQKVGQYKRLCDRQQMESIPFATLRTAMSEESGFRLHRLWKERYVASSLPLVALHPRWPQSMILVGNGPSARGKGVLIDSFECVVRFNLFTTAGHDVGSRMTDWCVSDNVAVHRTPRPWSNASANLFCIVGNSPYAHTDAAIRSRVPKHTVCVRPIVPVESDHWLSTGMLALHYFLRTRPTAALFVVGFDHFSGEYHYDTPIAPHAIPHTQDHAFFQRLQREFPHRIVRV